MDAKRKTQLDLRQNIWMNEGRAVMHLHMILRLRCKELLGHDKLQTRIEENLKCYAQTHQVFQNSVDSEDPEVKQQKSKV